MSLTISSAFWHDDHNFMNHMGIATCLISTCSIRNAWHGVLARGVHGRGERSTSVLPFQNEAAESLGSVLYPIATSAGGPVLSGGKPAGSPA